MAIAELVRIGSDVDVNEAICEWVGERIEAGDSKHDAGVYALARLREEGLVEAALDRWGAFWVSEVWAHNRVANYRSSMWALKRGRKPGSPEPGGRRIDLELLSEESSILETLWLVDSEWVRFGDMVKHQLRTLADKYLQSVENAQRKAEFFDKLATQIPKDKFVRVVYSEEQLRAMIVELGA
mgnify:FL=1